MPFIGYRLKKPNIPSVTMYGDAVNTLYSNATPGTPASGTSSVWFDSGLKKWRIKYDDGSIENLGAGASGPTAHKNSHTAGNSDAFVKGDALNAHARYLSTVSDPTTDNQRFWLTPGGSEIRYWDDQSTPVKQFVATTSTVQTFSNKTLNSTCDVSAAVTATPNIAFKNTANEFTEPQVIKKNTSVLETLWKPVNTNGTAWLLDFDANNSLNAQVTYAAVMGRIGNNAAGAEYGTFAVFIRGNGSLKNPLFIDKDAFWISQTDANYIKFSNGNLTADHLYDFPDVDGKLAGEEDTNTFAPPQTFEDYIDLKEIAEPSAPASGKSRLFRDSADGLFKVKYSDGDVVILG
jgi:hypothetical protein